jgi:hypothetical protein
MLKAANSLEGMLLGETLENYIKSGVKGRNPLISKINLKYVYTFSFYLPDNNLRLHYKDYSVNTV